MTAKKEPIYHFYITELVKDLHWLVMMILVTYMKNQET